MKYCPKCYIEHEDEVEICDCGYVFIQKKNEIDISAPPCPKCGCKEQILIGRFLKGKDDYEVNIEDVSMKEEKTYQCVKCKHLHSNEGFVSSKSGILTFISRFIFGLLRDIFRSG
jgi:hypothetical protein